MSIIFYYVNSLATGIVDTDTKNYLSSVTTEKKNQLEQTFQNLIIQNENLTRTPRLEYTITQGSLEDKKALRAFLKDIFQAGDGIYENVFIEFNRQILIDGINGASEGFSLNEKDFPDFSTVRETGESRLTHPQISPVSGRQVFMLLSPIKSARNSQVIGVIAAAIDLNNMAQKIIDQALVDGNQQAARHIESYLIDPSGLVLLANNKDSILSFNFAKAPETQELYSLMSHTSSGHSLSKINGIEHVVYFSKIPDSELTLLSTISVGNYLQPIRSLEVSLIITMCIGTLTCSLILSLFFYAITRPLLQRLLLAMRSAEHIAQNDLSHEIVVSGNDEGSRLLTALKQMHHDLKCTIKLIMHSSDQLTHTATTLNAQAVEAEDKINKQTNELQYAATAVSQLRVTFDSVAENASTVSQSSKSGTEYTKTGRARVAETSEAIQSFTKELNDTSGSVQALASHIEEMSSILDVIKSVAEQTNLLALNAAIESARAGEAGRGFAVVADEVRMLAQRTANSTSQIGEMVSSIDSHGKKAVADLISITKAALTTLSIAEKADEALQHIESTMESINDGNLMIASATEEQSQVVQEIELNLENINSDALIVHDKVHATSSASSELNKLAYDLRERMDKFSI